MLVPSSVMFKKATGRVDLSNHFNWWIYVPGADWRHPRGPASNIRKLMDHPVVHIAFEDAEAYCEMGRRRAAHRSGMGVRRARRSRKRRVRMGDRIHAKR
jgi:formylglycine-generating enzyme required for sulfatase activity